MTINRKSCCVWLTICFVFCLFFLLLLLLFFSPKKGKNVFFIEEWFDHILFMMLYLETIANDSHQTFAKMRLRDMPKATENGRC